jgi:hypothetical protein
MVPLAQTDLVGLYAVNSSTMLGVSKFGFTSLTIVKSIVSRKMPMIYYCVDNLAQSEVGMKRTVYFAEGVLQSLIGIGAVISGALLIIRPDGHYLQIPLDMLKNSPFRNFLIPGVILFLVIGVGNIVSAVLSFRIQRIAGFAGLFFGFGLVIWLFVQINLVGGGHWLQYLYFVLGIIQLLLGIAMRELERKS